MLPGRQAATGSDSAPTPPPAEPLQPNLSTQNPQLSATNLLNDLDRKTQVHICQQSVPFLWRQQCITMLVICHGTIVKALPHEVAHVIKSQPKVFLPPRLADFMGIWHVWLDLVGNASKQRGLNCQARGILVISCPPDPIAVCNICSEHVCFLS